MVDRARLEGQGRFGRPEDGRGGVAMSRALPIRGRDSGARGRSPTMSAVAEAHGGRTVVPSTHDVHGIVRAGIWERRDLAPWESADRDGDARAARGADIRVVGEALLVLEIGRAHV